MKSYSDGTVQLCFTTQGALETYYDGKCKYCGRPFHKKHNKSQYCSKECALNMTRENKARYQAKRRLRVKRKVLILPEYKISGMGSYGTSCNGHRKKDFKEEYNSIQKEFRRLKLRRNR